MANNNFVVQNGLTVGPLTINAATGDIVTTGNIIATSSISNDSVNTLTANVLVGGNNGNISLTGNILPSANITYNLGSPTQQFKSVYVGPGTLYVNGKPVITDNSGTIQFTTTPGQNLAILTDAGGNLQFGANGAGGVIQIQAPLQIGAGYNVTSSDGNAIKIANQVAVDSIVSRSTNTNLTLAANGTGKIAINNSITGGGTVTIADTTATSSSGTGALVVSGGVGVNGDIRVSGNVYSYGYINVSTSQLDVSAPLVYLTTSAPYPYSYDIGMYSHFIGGAANTYQHTGIVRNHADGVWNFFSNCISEPTTTINFSDPNFALDTINIGGLKVNGSSGTNGQFLQSTGSGLSWVTLSASSISNGTSNVSVASNAGITFNVAGANVVAVGSSGITPNANTTVNIGSTSNWFNNIYGTATHALYADLAENYTADKAYPAGTVVMFGGSAEVTLADADTTAVAGVVSTNPAHLMNGGLTGGNVVPLALQGRVPCQVIGPVKKGDLMVSAGFGFAKANNSANVGQVIGKALQEVAFAGKAVIEVVVGRV